MVLKATGDEKIVAGYKHNVLHGDYSSSCAISYGTCILDENKSFRGNFLLRCFVLDVCPLVVLVRGCCLWKKLVNMLLMVIMSSFREGGG